MPSDTVLAAVLAAVVAGYFGLVGLIVTKDAKTSDLRQAWIDALRNEVSQAASHFEAWSMTIYLAGPAQIVAAAEQRAKFRNCEASIRLRLNPHKELSKPAFKVLDEMAGMIAAGDRGETHVQAKSKELVTSIQPVLKEAWERVKRGESWFQGTKAASILLVAAGMALVGYLIYRGTLPAAAAEKEKPAAIISAAKVAGAGAPAVK